MKILMLHGINHNMFGKRDPAQYGTVTLDEINASLVSAQDGLLNLRITEAIAQAARSGQTVSLQA